MLEVTNSPRSPLRYPGGKAKISRFVADVVANNGLTNTYIEPFAGGAGIAINLLLANRVNNVVLNDLDDSVYSFWKTVLTDPEYLIKEIQKVPFDFENRANLPSPQSRYTYWRSMKQRFEKNNYRDPRRKAMDFFLLNRMNVSGIVTGGPIGGKAQTGTYSIASRFNKKTLIKRIEDIAALATRIKVTNYEASHFLTALSGGRICDISKSLLFVDPPYYVQGRNLYSVFATDHIHSRVAEALLGLDLDWLLTYDVADPINLLYPDSSVQKYTYRIQYSANKRGNYAEYLFTSPRLKVSSFANVELEPVFGSRDAGRR